MYVSVAVMLLTMSLQHLMFHSCIVLIDLMFPCLLPQQYVPHRVVEHGGAAWRCAASDYFFKIDIVAHLTGLQQLLTYLDLYGLCQRRCIFFLHCRYVLWVAFGSKLLLNHYLLTVVHVDSLFQGLAVELPPIQRVPPYGGSIACHTLLREKFFTIHYSLFP